MITVTFKDSTGKALVTDILEHKIIYLSKDTGYPLIYCANTTEAAWELSDMIPEYSKHCDVVEMSLYEANRIIEALNKG